MLVDLAVRTLAKLEAPLEVAVGRTKRALARQRQLLPPVNYLHRALLELHGIAARIGGRVDELASEGEVAVVIDADLGDDERRLARSDRALPDANCLQGPVLYARGVSSAAP